MDQQQYKKINDHFTPKTGILKNILKAFVSGGLFCVVGQLISFFYMMNFSFTEKTVGNPTVATRLIKEAGKQN